MKPLKFGKYVLVDKIALGGMAEIFKAKFQGASGFEKTIALKRILPHYTQSKEFITMFEDEAKICVSLAHANIVQVFDFGYAEESFYLAMEFVYGKNLRQILAKAENTGTKIPIDCIAFIISEATKGLDFAHRKTSDKTHDNLGIIHRDISPQNLMISYEGEVKIIDFGIAKAAEDGNKTRAGVLKGKFGYMSPEQANGLEIDQRTDIFSIGILLYEMLTMERLFVSDNDINTLKKIQECDIIKPSCFNPEIPKELEKIVLKGLAKERALRYQSARDFHRDVSKFLYSHNPDFTSTDLATFTKKLFSKEILDDKKQIQEILPPLINAQDKPIPDNSFQTSAPTKIKTIEKEEHRSEQKTIIEQISSAPVEPSPKESTPTPAPPQKQFKRNHSKNIRFFFALLILTGSVFLFFNKKESILRNIASFTGSNSGTIKIKAVPQEGNVFLNGNLIAQRTPATLPGIEKNKLVKIEVKKEGYVDYKKEIVLTENEMEINVILDKVTTYGSVMIESDPPGSVIFVNGGKVGETPLTIERIEAEKTHKLELTKDGFKPYEESLIIVPKQTKKIKAVLEMTADLRLQNKRKSLILINSNPSAAKVFINQKYIGTTPIQSPPLFQYGKYTMSIKKDGFEDIERTFVIAKKAEVHNYQLKKLGYGFLNLISHPEGAVYINGKKAVDRSPVVKYKLRAGKYKIRVENPLYKLKREIAVEIKTDSINTQEIYLKQ